jgi:hypothetical protein
MPVVWDIERALIPIDIYFVLFPISLDVHTWFRNATIMNSVHGAELLNRIRTMIRISALPNPISIF